MTYILPSTKNHTDSGYVWKFNQDQIDWEQLSELYRLAPLGEKPAEHLEKVFSNSKFKCFVFFGIKLIGVGRALADGSDCSYICDIAVHPEFQGIGLGKAIVEKLIAFSVGHKKIILYSNPGKEGFYQKLGFRRMNTAIAIFANNTQAIQSGLISEN
jgi:ribosomal protein S18 acetylase RimI-like enzyme